MKATRFISLAIAASLATLLAACSDPVSRVKKSRVDGSDLTYGEVLKDRSSCARTEWKQQEVEGGVYVNYTCTLAFDESGWNQWREQQVSTLDVERPERRWRNLYESANVQEFPLVGAYLAEWKQRIVDDATATLSQNKEILDNYLASKRQDQLAFVMQFRVPEEGAPELRYAGPEINGSQVKTIRISRSDVARMMTDPSFHDQALTYVRTQLMRFSSGQPQYVKPKVQCGYGHRRADSPNETGLWCTEANS